MFKVFYNNYTVRTNNNVWLPCGVVIDSELEQPCSCVSAHSYVIVLFYCYSYVSSVDRVSFIVHQCIDNRSGIFAVSLSALAPELAPVGKAKIVDVYY